MKELSFQQQTPVVATESTDHKLYFWKRKPYRMRQKEKKERIEECYLEYVRNVLHRFQSST